MRLHFKEILKRDDDEPTLENLEMKCQLEIIQGQTFIKSRHLAQKPTFLNSYLHRFKVFKNVQVIGFIASWIAKPIDFYSLRNKCNLAFT